MRGSALVVRIPAALTVLRASRIDGTKSNKNKPPACFLFTNLRCNNDESLPLDSSPKKKQSESPFPADAKAQTLCFPVAQTQLSLRVLEDPQDQKLVEEGL